MQRFIWPITVVLASILAPATGVLVWRATNTVVGPVDPEPAPVVETFASRVREAWAANGGTSEDACQLVDSYASIAGVLVADTDKSLKTTEDFDRFVRLGNKLAYGSEKPFSDKYVFLRDMLKTEFIARGICEDANKDGLPDSGPLKHEPMVQIISEVVEGLQ